MLCPVPNLQSFLAGHWQIARRIFDRQQGLVGRLKGCCHFAPAAQGLVYDEAGRLSFGSYQGEAARRYLFSFVQPAAALVHHADGSFFHAFNLSSGRYDILHQCAEDHYRGRYSVLNRGEFIVTWDVRGPRKGYHMTTFYRRQRPNRSRLACVRGQHDEE